MERRMKKIVLASLFVIAAATTQPVFAASGADRLCTKGATLCSCGKLPGAVWICCHAHAKCDCSGGLPNCKR
jgi:hypothetical protein